ncbi:PTS sugar transporter subunit IIB [Pseudescherichia sp.]|jgi:PTS system ascorbate-specific IIB component|uniref:PTS sugar transporter subunit IIB n=1 Tax=Pseudescherichia sp. TaxID=2055881 RepID=UPI002897B46A|nr:PTS sugar transporter subunit IIB [Pseudescherichia sp.]
MKMMAVCGSGLGSSFMMEMNIKKVLKNLNIEADVEHSDLGSVTPDVADVFVMAKDIAYSANLPENKIIIINNIIDLKEIEQKIREYFEKNNA